jgi:hypothetical protein
MQSIPWGKEVQWREANASIRLHLRRYAAELIPARRLARGQRRLLEQVAPLMETLCVETCPVCSDPCCSRADVYYDFPDLLYLQFLRLPLPDAQPRLIRNRSCAHLAADGCALPRPCRPWICTWFVCPEQRRLLTTRLQGLQERLAQALDIIKHHRRQIEAAYIQAVFPGGARRD